MLDLLYAAMALLTFLLALVLVPVAQKFGQRFGFVDKVDPKKIHSRPMVRCGGVGIYLAFMIGLAIAWVAGDIASWMLHEDKLAAGHAGQQFRPWLPAQILPYLNNLDRWQVAVKPAAVLLGATLLFLTGLADDRFNLRPVPKLLLQIVSAFPLLAAGVTIRVFLPEMLPAWIPPWLPEAILTVAWVVLLTNAFNFLDNMDGLSSGVAAVCALNFYLVSRAGGEYFMMGLFALLFGATVGFLRYNFAPGGARLFMGDSGSLFLGYMLAALSTLVTYYQRGVPTQMPVVSPLIILGVPLFDTASVMWIRWRAGKPLMQGDQNHFSHRLVALGFSRRDAVKFIYLVTLTVGLSALNLRELSWGGAALALFQVVLIFLVIWFLEKVAREKRASQIVEGGANK